MKNAKKMIKQGASKEEVQDFFDNDIQDEIALVVLESNGLYPLFSKIALETLDKLSEYDKYNLTELIGLEEKQTKIYKRYEGLMKDVIEIAKRKSRAEVEDFFNEEMQDELSYVILESKGLLPNFQKNAQKALASLLTKVKDTPDSVELPEELSTEGRFYKRYEKSMTEAINFTKTASSQEEVEDFFDKECANDIAFVILKSKGLIPLYQNTAQNALAKLVKLYDKYNPKESPFKEDEEEYTDDVEAELPGYKLTYEDDKVQMFEETVKPKPIKLTPSVFKRIPAPKPSSSVFQPPPMPTKEEEYEYQRENNALARIRVFEGHKNVKSVF